jgi:hypothetical protein
VSQRVTSSPRAAAAPETSGRVWRLSRRTRRRAIALGILAAILVAVLLLAFDAVWSARRMLHGIAVARNDLIDATNSVVTGDPNASVASFKSADDAAGLAVSAAGHPGIRILDVVPWLGDNIDAARAVAVSMQSTSKAGLSMAGAASALGWDDLSLPATNALNDVDLSAVRAATPKIDDVAAQLQDAVDQLTAAGSPHLFGPVANGYDDALSVLQRRAALATDASRLFHLLPRLLGGSHRYLLAVQSLSRPANPAGRLGAVGVLTASGGRVSVEPLQPADRPIADAVTSMDVPTDAKAMLAAAADLGIEDLDGVILMDTAGLQDLLWMVGDVQLADLTEPMSQNDAVTTLDRDVFAGTDAAASEQQQALLAGEALTAALEQRPSTEAFGTGFAQMLNGRDLAIYSTDPGTQAWLRRLGATGALDTSGNLLALQLESTADNRTGTFLRRPVSVVVSLDDEGTASLRTVMDVNNDAPDDPPSVLLGEAFVEHPIGSFSGDARIYLPAQADRISIETSTPGPTSIDEDLGVPVATAGFTVPSNGSTSVIMNARVTSAAVKTGNTWSYVIRILPQPQGAPQPLRVLVHVPSGRSVVDASDQMDVAGGQALYLGSPSGAITLFVSYR